MNYVLKDIFRQGAENLPCLSIRNKCVRGARKKTDGNNSTTAPMSCKASMDQSNVLQAGNYRGLTLAVMCRIEVLQCKTPAAKTIRLRTPLVADLPVRYFLRGHVLIGFYRKFHAYRL